MSSSSTSPASVPLAGSATAPRRSEDLRGSDCPRLRSRLVSRPPWADAPVCPAEQGRRLGYQVMEETICDWWMDAESNWHRGRPQAGWWQADDRRWHAPDDYDDDDPTGEIEGGPLAGAAHFGGRSASPDPDPGWGWPRWARRGPRFARDRRRRGGGRGSDDRRWSRPEPARDHHHHRGRRPRTPRLGAPGHADDVNRRRRVRQRCRRSVCTALDRASLRHCVHVRPVPDPRPAADEPATVECRDPARGHMLARGCNGGHRGRRADDVHCREMSRRTVRRPALAPRDLLNRGHGAMGAPVGRTTRSSPDRH